MKKGEGNVKPSQWISGAQFIPWENQKKYGEIKYASYYGEDLK